MDNNPENSGGKEKLPEDIWIGKATTSDYNDKAGNGRFRCIVESVKACDIHEQSIEWCARVYSLITAASLAGQFPLAFLEDQSKMFGRYMIELESKLDTVGIEYYAFKGITKKGWETYGKVKKTVSQTKKNN